MKWIAHTHTQKKNYESLVTDFERIQNGSLVVKHIIMDLQHTEVKT